MLRIFTPVKIQRLRPGLNPQTLMSEASMLTTRPPKPSTSEGILTILFLIDLNSFNVRMLLDLEIVERQTEFNTTLLFICLHC